MSLPPDQLRKLFSRRVKRGTVLLAKIRFHETGTEKPKYIVIVSRDPVKADPLVFFITTSQLAVIERTPLFRENSVFLDVGTVSFFPLRTAINCREPEEFVRADVADLFANGEAKIVGDLPDDVMRQIDDIVRLSVLISPADKKKILD